MEYIVYKIICKDETIKDCYVGLTNNFIKRQYNHKADLKRKSHTLQLTINNNGGWDNWNIIEIEKINNTLQIAKERETYWIKFLNSNLNMRWSVLDVENIKQRTKIYDSKRNTNKKISCECGCIITKHHLNQHKQSIKHKKYIS